MPKTQKRYEGCSNSCSSTELIPSQQIQESREEPRFTVAIRPSGRARTPLLDQKNDRTLSKSSRAFQSEFSETLTPLPDVPDAGTLVAAVPVQRDRRSMSHVDRDRMDVSKSVAVRFHSCFTETF